MKEEVFRFRRFNVRNCASALKLGTDAVLLGAAMTLKPTDRRLLDIGTGTGVIALMAAQRLSDLGSDAAIDGIDIDAPSAEEAAANFVGSPWSGMLHAECVSLQDYRPSAGFDLIFSNPPFYDNSLQNPDHRESVARHTEALSYRDICAFASGQLREDGRLALILPSEVETSLLRTAASFGLFPFRIIHIRTTARKAPRRIITEFSRTRNECLREELVLQDGPIRTAEYNKLTENFYL